MSNLRIKNKRLKREIERLRGLTVPVNVYKETFYPTTLRSEVLFDWYEYYRMTTDDCFDSEDYIRGRLIDEMRDELIKHMTVESHHDIYRDMVIVRGELGVIDVGKETR